MGWERTTRACLPRRAEPRRAAARQLSRPAEYRASDLARVVPSGSSSCRSLVRRGAPLRADPPECSIFLRQFDTRPPRGSLDPPTPRDRISGEPHVNRPGNYDHSEREREPIEISERWSARARWGFLKSLQGDCDNLLWFRKIIVREIEIADWEGLLCQFWFRIFGVENAENVMKLF